MADEKSIVKMNKMIHKKTGASLVVYVIYVSLVYTDKVCTISFERPVNYLCDAWHVFPPKYEAWTHFNRP